jgi:hypothetical protein
VGTFANVLEPAFVGRARAGTVEHSWDGVTYASVCGRVGGCVAAVVVASRGAMGPGRSTLVRDLSQDSRWLRGLDCGRLCERGRIRCPLEEGNQACSFNLQS